jgi:hypothetical protein
LSFAKYLTPLPIILLSFGVLLGAGNIITLFSIKQKINFHFLILIAIIIAGFFNESHNVNLTTKTEKERLLKRPALRDYFQNWIEEKNIQLSDSSKTTLPIYFVLADGGASRSAYWTASVLSKIETETKGAFSKHLFCLSGASGGSLGNIAFWGTLAGEKKTDPTQEIQDYLSNDFLSFPLVRLLGPDIILPLIPFHILHDRAEALERSMQHPDQQNKLGELMKANFSSTIPTNETASTPIICINCK